MGIKRLFAGLGETVSTIQNAPDIIQNIVDDTLIPFILHTVLGIMLLVGSAYLLVQLVTYLYRRKFGPPPVVLADWQQVAKAIQTGFEAITMELRETREMLARRDPMTTARNKMQPLPDRMRVDDYE